MALSAEATSARIKSITTPIIGAGAELGRQKLFALIAPTVNNRQTLELTNPFRWEANFAVITTRISQLFTFGLFLAGEQARVSRTGEAAHWLLSFTRGAVALAAPAIAVASVKAIEILGDNSASIDGKIGAGFVALTALFAVGSMAESGIQIIKLRKEKLKEQELIARVKRGESNNAAFDNLIKSWINLLDKYQPTEDAKKLLFELATKNPKSFLVTIKNLRREGQDGLNLITTNTVQQYISLLGSDR